VQGRDRQLRQGGEVHQGARARGAGSRHTASKHPADERIAAFRHERKAEGGETGKPLVRVYGRTDYNYNKIRLTFERDK
jgi:hypothetical protein